MTYKFTLNHNKILFENKFFQIINNNTSCENVIMLSLKNLTEQPYVIKLDFREFDKDYCESIEDIVSRKYLLKHKLLLKKECSCAYPGMDVYFSFEKLIDKKNESISNVLLKLKNISENNNFKINCFDGEINTNLYFLQANSDWFKNIDSFKEKEEIKCDYKKETMDLLINLLYFQEVPLNDTHQLDLIEVSDYYQFEEIKNKLIKNFKINVNNVLMILTNEKTSDDLKNSCIKFFKKTEKKNRQELYKSPKWSELSVEVVSKILFSIDS